jgi:hypothetical protein
MHTTEMKSGVLFHHNGDFSGEIYIVAPNVDDDKNGRVKVSFEDLKEFVAEYYRDKLISKIEEAGPDEILAAAKGLLNA